MSLLDALCGNSTLGSTNSSLLASVMSTFLANVTSTDESTQLTARFGAPSILSSPSTASTGLPSLPSFAIAAIACGGALFLCCLLCLCWSLSKQREKRRKSDQFTRGSSFSGENPLRGALVVHHSKQPRVAGETRRIIASASFGHINPVHSAPARPDRLSGISTTDRVNPLRATRTALDPELSRKSDAAYALRDTSSKVAAFPGSPTRTLVVGAGSSSSALHRMSAVVLESPATRFPAASATAYRPKRPQRDIDRSLSNSSARRRARRSAEAKHTSGAARTQIFQHEVSRHAPVSPTCVPPEVEHPILLSQSVARGRVLSTSSVEENDSLASPNSRAYAPTTVPAAPQASGLS
jgi:hypothetical protein